MNEVASINWALVAPLVIIQIILQVVALIDLRKVYATNGPKVLWIVIILFGGMLGSIAYFIAGRKHA